MPHTVQAPLADSVPSKTTRPVELTQSSKYTWRELDSVPEVLQIRILRPSPVPVDSISARSPVATGTSSSPTPCGSVADMLDGDHPARALHELHDCVVAGRPLVVPQLFVSVHERDSVPPLHADQPPQDQFGVQLQD